MTDSRSGLEPDSPLEVVPLLGVPPLRFGMSGAEVKRIAGEPSRERQTQSYFSNGRLQVDYPDGKVSFFQISWEPGSPRVMYGGVSVFETPAEELVEHIGGERCDREHHDFKDFELDLGLWRPTLPRYHDPTEPEDEYRNGRYWMTIAIGHGGLMREWAEKAAAIGGSQDRPS